MEALEVFLRGVRCAILKRSMDLTEIDDLANEFRRSAVKSMALSSKFKKSDTERERYLLRAEMLEESASYLQEYIFHYLKE